MLYKIGLICLTTFLFSFNSMARHIFLNGVDIGNLRDETLENVIVKIAPNGDIFIEAPHLKAVEEIDYVPYYNPIKDKKNKKHIKDKDLQRKPSDLTDLPTDLSKRETDDNKTASEVSLENLTDEEKDFLLNKKKGTKKGI